MADITAALPQRKMSRYRAQRIQDKTEYAPPVPSVPDSPKQEEEGGMARSKSRYRKQNRSNTQNSQDSPKMPKSRPSQSSLTNGSPPPRTATIQRIEEERQPLKRRDLTEDRPMPMLSHRVDSGKSIQAASSSQDLRKDRYGTGSRDTPSSQNLRQERQATGARDTPPSRNPRQEKQRAGSRDTPSSQYVRQERQRIESKDSPPMQAASQRQRTGSKDSPPAQASLVPPPLPPPPILDGPPSSDKIRATKSTAQLPKLRSERSGPFSFFKRKHGTPSSPRISSPIHEPEEKDIIIGGAGAVPGTDAPVSAVNAGDRRVLIECGAFKMMFPVTPTTTPVDLIKSAATTMSNPVDVKSAILLEHFATVGVHRPLRRYEHIRDVMNSWDNDTQNSLLLIDPGTGRSELELSLLGVPKNKPAESSWLLYYSQTPGKWDKRMVHLKRDGQLAYQKDPKKPQEQINICHLSDFDVYTPTQEKLKKKVKPPKKHCFAIKSQQKSIMFENTTTFVHFFATGDAAIGENFNRAVQAWRSWYLVNVMGEGKKKLETPVVEPDQRRKAEAKLQIPQTHKRMSSLDSHYALGTFSPLVDLDIFSKSGTADAIQQPETVTSLARKPSKAGGKYSLDPPNQGSSAMLGRRTSQRQHQRPATQGVDRPRTSADQHRPLIDLARHTSQRRNHIKTGGLIDSVPDNDTSSPRQSMSQQRASLQGDANAFTGEGLLASTQSGWGDGKKGRGVIDGSRAKGPMVDLGEMSQFQQGSLLRKVEKSQGPPGVNIDRQKWQERIEKTGEGF